MGKGGGRGRHKEHSRSKKFTPVAQLEKDTRKQRRNPDDEDDEETSEEETSEEETSEESGDEGDKAKKAGTSGEGEAGASDEAGKQKGPPPVFETANPNAVASRSVKAKDADLEADAPELSRREREELEKQRAKERYWKLHLEGKTEEAKKDLERLAIIKKQREEAARKRAEEAAAKEAKKLEARKK